ncbi:DUF3109 family protein [Prosthecochloris sp. N3]|uniref:DUF3109 family protein n=1 Tax=Prosthecochloris ethylica TaxID=2743976 RepID=A0ABR9XT71_9CHLB|nr:MULTISPECIES: DUF3109 family protein [Prosthecochloris]MEC9486687.1 DUF3109 family protein [Prosthecochloris sp.]MBF0586969.1 DUF3109 family protein [Prosthecochloris ethylica]MBF0637154.1 DUF3109 family protein [Prosthecochloris ethylica]NUK48162.1 DUF3109 family protein [Prosthecochloris ethylica]RNA64864.1 DUF3109 family protein [Prosthecochloris sp. ZM_2]
MSIISVEHVLVDKAVIQAFFSCDLSMCRGACCVEGELGAPVSPVEAGELETLAEELRDRLSEHHLRFLRRHGALERYRGELYTRTIDGGACVFAFEREGVTLCAIEDAQLAGRMTTGKPVSCRLFPIRVRKKFGLDYLVYEQHAMCRHARSEGTAREVPLVDFLQPVLEERYGAAWYQRLKDLSANSPMTHA